MLLARSCSPPSQKLLAAARPRARQDATPPGRRGRLRSAAAVVTAASPRRPPRRSPRCPTRPAWTSRPWTRPPTLRRLLPVLLRRLAEEQSHPRRPGALERLLASWRRTISASCGASSTSRHADRRPHRRRSRRSATTSPPAWTKALEKAGAAPAAAGARRRSTAASPCSDLPRLLAGCSSTRATTASLRLRLGQDFADSTRVIAFAVAGGLGLPDRDYYLKTDAKSEGDPPEVCGPRHAACSSCWATAAGRREDARRHGHGIETALAKASLTRVEQRDPHKLYHRLNARKLRPLTPAFDWNNYLASIGSGGATTAQRHRARSSSQSSTRSCATRNAGRLEDLPALAPGARRRAVSCPRRSSTRTSTSTASTCAAYRSCSRAGSAACAGRRPDLGEALGPGVRRQDLQPRAEGSDAVT